MTFKDYINAPRENIKERLSVFLENKKSEDLPQVFKEQKLIEELGSFTSRGKLVRGSLFLLSSEMLGKAKDQELVDIAVAIELMHSSLLVQDDVIDRDYMRRGEATIFAKFEDQGKKLNAFDPYHYGVSTSYVIADIAFLFAVELISNFSDPKLARLLKYYSHEIYLVALSESVDSLFGQTDKEPTKEEIFAVYKYKTARYTFSLPFEMASIVAGVNADVSKDLGSLGESMGIIYQLKDDELGLFGNEHETGKPVGGDIRENKKTYIRYLLYKKADTRDKIKLDDCFGNSKASYDEVEIVKGLYEKYKIGGLIDDEINIFVKSSNELLNSLDVSEEFKTLLRSLLEFNLTRKA